ncbi:unnamed protein product [Mycena citricolor]|uniref:Uncharacterized protein n=1 Tax=Mycena citricolor TaxID=2018698 RepID=A0AAD2K6B6_9AGAR|nr:unnamed protein product [Mycena citricolor]
MATVHARASLRRYSTGPAFPRGSKIYKSQARLRMALPCPLKKTASSRTSKSRSAGPQFLSGRRSRGRLLRLGSSGVTRPSSTPTSLTLRGKSWL